MKRLIFSLCLLLLCSCAARERTGIERLRPCVASEGPSDGYCGDLSVWEDRAAKRGRRIGLHIVVLPALKQRNAPDPLFVLAGGPGQAATEYAEQLGKQFRPVQTDRDIVFVDQRGTGRSNRLDCPSSEDDDESIEATLARYRQCFASLSPRADLTKYTTDAAMDDLDDVRRFLGYDRIDLYGVSYGSRAAIVYARRHREHTRAVVLDGVFPVEARFPTFLPRDSQRALDLLFRDCDQDPRCRTRFPDLPARLRTVLARLSSQPLNVRIIDPRSGLEREREVRRSTISGALLAALYSPITASAVPLLIDEAAEGNYRGFFALRTMFEPEQRSIARGMQMSVLCSEDAPLADAASMSGSAAGTFLGLDFTRLSPCAFWPRATLDPASLATAASDAPALVLSGDLDPVTPPSWGNEIASHWKHARHIVVPGTGHNAAFAACVMPLIGEFLNAGDASRIDDSCVQHVKRPPFLLGPSGPDPEGK